MTTFDTPNVEDRREDTEVLDTQLEIAEFLAVYETNPVAAAAQAVEFQRQMLATTRSMYKTVKRENRGPNFVKRGTSKVTSGVKIGAVKVGSGARKATNIKNIRVVFTTNDE